MLTTEENLRLTQVGPGTPMGELLRRYWMPIAAVAELADSPTKRIRLLSEDLVLYRDRSGHYGLVDAYCAHRGNDLSRGIVEECGLRCNYHGWMFDKRGKCLSQPFEERTNFHAAFKDRVRIKAYPVQSNAGIIWAYLGPEPAPLVPNWRNFHKKGYKHICVAHLSCNWLQAMENSFDQVHNEWMHDKWSYYLRDGSVPDDRWQISKFIHREFDYGWTAEVQYVGRREIFPDRIILWPNYNFVHLFEWYVPVDDHNTLMVLWHNVVFRADAPFKQDRIPCWTALIKEPGTEQFLTRPPRNQDVAVWTGQGRIVDRTREHLGLSDTGIIEFRKKLFEQMKVVEGGGEPKAVVREPDKYFVMLPEPVPSGPERDGLPGALLTPADMRTIGYLAGFPQHIADEIEKISRERGEQELRGLELKRAGWKVGGKEFRRERHFLALKKHGLSHEAGDRRIPCIHECFEEQVSRNPDAVALLYRGQEVKYHFLNSQANQLARRLISGGVHAEAVVGVCLNDAVRTVVSLLAILKAGGVYLPLDPQFPPYRVQQVLADSKPVVILADQAHKELFGGIQVLDPGPVSTEPEMDNTANIRVAVESSNAAYLIYTSGSTGEPKGVVSPHWSITGTLTSERLFDETEVCCLSKSVHIGASIPALLHPLLRGIRIVVIPDDQVQDLRFVLNTIGSANVTRIGLVPSQLRELIKMGSMVRSTLSKLRTVAVTGEVLSRDLVDAFRRLLPEARIVNGYTATEIGALASRSIVKAELSSANVPIGTPISNTQIYILDAEMRPAPAGDVGELYVWSTSMTRGYLNKPALTAERFLPNPFCDGGERFYRTGDLGRYLPDGEIECVGRVIDQVKVRGLRVELSEVEGEILRNELVAECTITQTDTNGQLVCYLVSEPGAFLTAGDLRSYLHERLPEYMVPSHFVFLDRLPRTSNGKLNRAALPTFRPSRPDLDRPYAPPRNDLETRLAKIWSGLLQIQDIGIHDKFLELGGDSLIATALMMQIEKEFGIQIPVSGLWQMPTIGQLASYLAADVVELKPQI